MKIIQTNGDAGSFKEDFPLFVWEPEEQYGHVMCPNSESFFAENKDEIEAMQAEIKAGRELWISFKSGFKGANVGVFKQILVPFIENPQLDLYKQTNPVFSTLNAREKGFCRVLLNALFAEQRRVQASV